MSTDAPRSPLELLEALAVEEVEIAPGLAHLEVYTLHGLLSVLWHGPRAAHDVVVTCGGGMGGVLGPAGGIYHALGCELADAHGIATMRVGYRKPNDLSRGSYFGRRRPEDGRIDWSKSAQEIHNLVRAVAPPFPGAFCDRFRVNRTQMTPLGANGRPPGPYQDNGQWFAVCGDGKVLRLLEVQEKK